MCATAAVPSSDRRSIGWTFSGSSSWKCFVERSGPMIAIRRDPEIYEAEGGWFHARWHFSFDQYYDPAWVQFGSLRVFNDDRLIPGVAWPMHPHKDIEGITYVVEGFFQHADSLRGDDYPVLPAGAVQRMTLGAGAWHSEEERSGRGPRRCIDMW